MINNSFDPMPSVNSLQFKKEYISILKDKEKELQTFFSIIEPFIKELVCNCRNSKGTYYFYIFLKKNIESINIDSSFLDKWIEEPTFKQDVHYIACHRLRNAKTIPYNANPVMAKYYFVTDLRLAFSNFLKKRHRQYKRNTITHPEPAYEAYTYVYPNKINDNFWRNYMFFMLKSGYSITEISKLTGYSRVTLYKELKNDNKKRSN